MANGISKTLRPRRAPIDPLERVARFRDSAKELGMVQVNVYVPEERKAWIQAQAEYYRAEAMLRVVDEVPATDPGRMALANRNYATIPSRENVEYLETLIRANGFTDLKDDLAAVRAHTTSHNSYRHAVASTKNDDEMVYSLSSQAVAHSMMAAAAFRLLKLTVEDRLPQGGK